MAVPDSVPGKPLGLGSASIHLVVPVLVLPLFLLPLGAAAWQVLAEAGTNTSALVPGPSALAALRFSLVQASLSTILALVLGLPGAWLMASTRFRGKALFRAIHSIPFVFPPVLFSLGFIGVWGNSGFINSILAWLTGSKEPVLDLAYSFWAIVLAHGLFNFPLVGAILAPLMKSQTRDLEDAARMLGASSFRAWFGHGLPALAPGIGAAASLVFLYCFMSFTIPLLLGGGPRFATLEVSILVAINQGNGLAKAGVLAFLEFSVAVVVLLVYQRCSRAVLRNASGQSREQVSLRSLGPAASILARLWLVLGALLALSPVLSLLVSSLQVQARPGAALAWSLGNYARLAASPDVLRSFFNALVLALASGSLSCLIALALVSRASGEKDRGIKKLMFTLPLAISPVFLALGYLILFPGGAEVPALVLVQASMAYPLVYRSLAANRSQWLPSLHQAAAVLGASPWQQFITLDLPLLRNSLLSSMALSMALSLGDVNGPLLLNVPHFPLPGLQAYQLMGAYQYGQASALGVLICLLAFMAFAVLQEKESQEG